MLLACVQTDVTFGSVNSNLRRVAERADEAARYGPDLVVFPECVLTADAFDSPAEASPHAIPFDSPRLANLTRLAREYSIHISLGFCEQHRDRLFNAAMSLGRDGTITVYRKIHLPQLGDHRFADRRPEFYDAILRREIIPSPTADIPDSR